MNIGLILKYLNDTKNTRLSVSPFNTIDNWLSWWKGFYKPFHSFTESTSAGKITRELYTLKMAKKICEDWSSMLLNEDTKFTLSDKKTHDFIMQVFEYNNFKLRGNELIEKAFATGTGAFILRLEDIAVTKGGDILKDKNTKIYIDYVSAMQIIPITVKRGRIIDVCFVSEVLKTNTNIPMFSIIKPNICDNQNQGSLGISIFANAIDQLKGVDLAYNNLNRDIKLGGKKVFLNESLVQLDKNNNTLTPDDVAQQLFVTVGDQNLSDDKTMIVEHNPLLRAEENSKIIQTQLDLLSFKCGLGSKFYQFKESNTVTATEYAGERQDLIKNINKHYKTLDQALTILIRGIIHLGVDVLGLPLDFNTDIKIDFDDSYVSDTDSERLRDLQDVREGLMQKWEYRSKWYGEDEDTAKKMISSDDTTLGLGD